MKGFLVAAASLALGRVSGVLGEEPEALPTCIVGSGIGGIAVADFVHRKTGTSAIIFEKEDVIGGKIRTSYAGSQTYSGTTSPDVAVRGGGDQGHTRALPLSHLLSRLSQIA